MRKNTVILSLFIFMFHLDSFGQNDYKFGLSHRLLFNDFIQKASDAKIHPKNLPRGMEFNFSKRIKNGMRLNVPLRIGFTKSPNDTTTLGRTFYGGDLQWQFEYAKYRVVPYITTGVSIHKRLGKMDFGFPAFIGLNFRVEEGFSLNIQSGYRLSLSKGNNSWHHGIGLVFNIGKIPPPKIPLILPTNRPIDVVEALDIIGWWENPLFRTKLSNVLLSTRPKVSISDSDQDGVADNIDDCPEVKGLVSNRGCPAADLSWLQDANHIAFEFGKSSLTQESYTFLDKIVKLLHQNPQINISIQGHTDNRGSVLSNQKLSENRAKTCFDYLVNNGIDINRIDYIGFGESQPIADNATENGRSQNRRAVFIVSNLK